MSDGVHRRKSRGIARILRSLVTLRGSSRAIAGGVAIGTFVAFTPTSGFQMILAAFLATLLGANRPAAVLPVWITNPVTTVPGFLLTYRVGCMLWPGSTQAHVRARLAAAVQRMGEHGALELGDQAREFLKPGVGIFVPLAIGGIVVGLVAAVTAYIVSL